MTGGATHMTTWHSFRTHSFTGLHCSFGGLVCLEPLITANVLYCQFTVAPHAIHLLARWTVPGVTFEECTVMRTALGAGLQAVRLAYLTCLTSLYSIDGALDLVTAKRTGVVSTSQLSATGSKTRIRFGLEARNVASLVSTKAGNWHRN